MFEIYNKYLNFWIYWIIARNNVINCNVEFYISFV